MRHLARELRMPCGPTPTISQSTARSLVGRVLGPKGSGRLALEPSWGVVPLREAADLRPAPMAAFRDAQLEFPTAPAAQATSQSFGPHKSQSAGSLCPWSRSSTICLLGCIGQQPLLQCQWLFGVLLSLDLTVEGQLGWV